MSNSIKIGFLLSCDYEYLKYFLPCVYEHADLLEKWGSFADSNLKCINLA